MLTQPAPDSDTTFPIYEDRAAYAPWLRWVLVLTLAATLVPGIAVFSSEPLGAWTLLGTTAFDALLFHAVLPRRFQILPDRLRIVLGYPFAFNIRLTTVREARAVDGIETMVYWGVRLATSTRSAVEIVRYRGLNVIISPADRQTFIQQLNHTLTAAARRA